MQLKIEYFASTNFPLSTDKTLSRKYNKSGKRPNLALVVRIFRQNYASLSFPFSPCSFLGMKSGDMKKCLVSGVQNKLLRGDYDRPLARMCACAYPRKQCRPPRSYSCLSMLKSCESKRATVLLAEWYAYPAALRELIPR